ncbi:MAG: nonstructural protein [Arizlama microvirus]|nr:MAG: nonstructural protein [Arizlama microvirus]
MNLRMFSIYDIKAESFMTPFFFPANGQAVRAFSDLANDKNTLVGRHPSDYKLCYIGDFDDDSAEFLPSGVISLGFATDFVERSSVIPLGVSNG